MFLRNSLILLFSLSATISWAQSDYPTYAPPLKSTLRVSGTFGELRGNHYHAGIDFKADTGTPVYSVGDGYVSRIKIQPGGYGQAIYIDHPQGYHSVYGHLDALAPALLDTVRAAQRQEQYFAQDLRFGPEDFPVRRGEQIGKVGNRGYSFGSHLHFEMRSQENDAALNPFNFGIKVVDTRPPQLRKVKIYEYDGHQKLLREQTFSLVQSKNGDYTLADTVEVLTNEVAMAIKAFDRQNAMPNYNGPYALSITRDSISTYAVKFDSLPFEETRCINAHVDFKEWTNNKSWYHRLYSLPGIQHGYFEVRNIGKLPEGEAGQTEEIDIEVRDWAGNTSRLKFYVRYGSGKIDPVTPTLTYYQLPWSQRSIINTDQLRLEFPKGSLYENLDFTYANSLDTSSDVVSMVHHLHRASTPLHIPARIQLTPNHNLDPGKWDKVVLARCDDEGDPTSYGGALDSLGEPIFLPILSFGTYCLMLDENPPRIEALDPINKLGRRSRIRFKITDNFGSSGRARGLRFRASLDGEWVLFEYDLKKDIIYHDLQSRLPAAGAKLRIWVTDDRDNEAIWEGIIKS